MHLVTITTVPPFHFLSVPPCRHAIRRPCHRATITLCHLPLHSTVPHATKMPQPCCRETWCDTVPLCHQRATWCTTVPPCHLVRHRAPGAPACHSAAALLTRHIGIPMYTHAPDCCQSYLLILSDAISLYGLLLKISMTNLLCFRRRIMKFPINIS